MTRADVLDNFAGTVSRWMARMGGLCLLGVTLLISLEVLVRTTRLASWSIGTELSAYALAIGATWSLAYVVFERAHVRVDVILQRMSSRGRAVLDIAGVASLAAVGAILTWGAFGMFATSVQLMARSNTTLGIPLAWPHGLWTFGLAWFTAVALLRTAVAIRALVHGDLVKVARIAASPTADDEAEEAVHETEHRLVEKA